MENIQDGANLPLDDLTKEEIVEKYNKLNDKHSEITTANTRSTQEWQKLNRVIKVWRDKNEFTKLYDSDKKMAQSVVDYFNEIDNTEYVMQDYIDFVKKDKAVDKDEELLNKMEDRLAAKDADKIFDKYLKDKDIDEWSDFWKDFLKIYEWLMEGKKKTSKIVKDLLGIAMREAKMTSEFADKYNEIQASVQWPGSRSAKPQNQTKPRKRRKESAIFDYIKK